MEILFIILLTICSYFPTIFYGIIVDDIKIYKHHEMMVKAGRWKTKKIYGKIRVAISRLYGGATFGTNTKIDHAFTIFLHTVACILIYLALGKNSISFWAAILYCINPINNQTAIWLNGRRYSINIILVLLMLLFKPWGALLYLLTPLFQITAIFSPVLLGYQYLAAVPIFLFIIRKELRHKYELRMKDIHTDDHRKFFPKKIIPITKTYGFYFFNMILPLRTFMIYPFLFYWGMTKEGNKQAYRITNLDFAKGIAAFLLTTTALFYFNGQERLYIVFFALATLQWCGFLTITQMNADRYAGLPNIFMMYFISLLANKFLGIYGMYVVVCLAGFYMANLYVTMRMYKNMGAFWDYHMYWNFNDVKTREFKATFLIKKGDPMGAWDIVKEGLIRNPFDFKMNLMAAACMNIMQDKPNVVHYLKVAKENCYIGQEFIYYGVQKDIFGIDIDKEMELISSKQSKMDRTQRENLKNIYDRINGLDVKTEEVKTQQ